MTGGQASPTTPTGKFASTTPFGNPDSPFHISELAKAAGANYVARTTTYHTAKMDKYMEQGFQKEGFSVIEILTMCPTSYGHANPETGGKGVEMLKYQKNHSISRKKAKDLSEQELKGKFITGVYVNQDKPSYLANYQKVIDKANQ